MSEEWEDTTLGEVATFVNGFPFKPEHLSGKKLPVIRIKQLLDERNEVDYTDLEVPQKNIIDDGDLIFSWSGTLASRFWTRGKAALNQHLFRVTANAGSDLGWVHLALDYAVDELMTKTHGTTMKHVTKKVLESHKVARPPLPVQRRIVDLMTHLDEHIANLQAEQRALSLVASNYRDSTLSRWLQGGCREESLASVALRAPDYGLGLAATEEAIGPKYLRTTDVISGHIDWSAVQYCDASDSERQKATLHDGDVVVARTGANAGAGALIKDPPDGAVFAGYLVRFRPDATRVNSVFVSEVLQSSLWADYVARTRTGSAQPQFNAKLMGAFPLPLPPIAEQRAFADVLTSIEEGKYSLQSEEQALGAARRKVLSLLLAGHVQPDASYDSLIAEAS